MFQVWIYDENNIFIESDLVHELSDKMTRVPLTVGYIKPKFNESKQEWFEGATEQEITEWFELNNKPSEQTNMEQLSEYILMLEMKNLELEEQTTINSEYVLDLDTRLTTIETTQGGI